MNYLGINISDIQYRKAPLLIVTFGPSGTSSEQAAHFFREKILKQSTISVGDIDSVTYEPDIALFNTFKEVLSALINSKISLAVIPNAYEKINEFYINPYTLLTELFIHDTPSYGLAKKDRQTRLGSHCKIVTHPAPIGLVDFLLNKLDKKIEKYSIEYVSSTSIAAKMVKEGEADLAITNEVAAINNHLEIIASYGSIKMSWAVFSKNIEEIKA